jgi:hypothetical protein
VALSGLAGVAMLIAHFQIPSRSVNKNVTVPCGSPIARPLRPDASLVLSGDRDVQGGQP